MMIHLRKTSIEKCEFPNETHSITWIYDFGGLWLNILDLINRCFLQFCDSSEVVVKGSKRDVVLTVKFILQGFVVVCTELMQDLL